MSPVGGGAGAAAGLRMSALVHTVLHSLASASPCGSMPPAARTTWNTPCVRSRQCFKGRRPSIQAHTGRWPERCSRRILTPSKCSASANSWQQEREACRRAVDASSGVGQRRKRAGRPPSCGGAQARPPIGGHARHTLAPGALLAQWGALQDAICAHSQRARHGCCAQHLCAAAGAGQPGLPRVWCSMLPTTHVWDAHAEGKAGSAMHMPSTPPWMLLVRSARRTCQKAQQQRPGACRRCRRMTTQPHAKPARKAGATKKVSRSGSRPSRTNWAVTPRSTTAVAGWLRYNRQFRAWSAHAAPAPAGCGRRAPATAAEMTAH